MQALNYPMCTLRHSALLVAAALMAPVYSIAQEQIHLDGFETLLACDATPAGIKAVAEPALIATLHHDFNDSWLGSPAIVDLDNDQTNEILVSRFSKVIGFHLDNSVAQGSHVLQVLSELEPDIPPDDDELQPDDSIDAAAWPMDHEETDT